MKKVLLIVFFVTTASFAQKNINNYKYVIVPIKFDFVKEKNKYLTSSLTKFLFNKYGFTAFLDEEELPDELANNRCLALTGTVKDNSNMFTTKSIIELRDCHNNVVYTSQVGKSKEKEYKKAYHEAIRNAFKSVQGLGYKYIPKAEETTIVTATPVKVVEVPTTAIIKNGPVEIVEKEDKLNVLYAQSIPNGFQLVNMKPVVVFVVLKTSVKNVFILKNKNGILYQNGTSWFAEYYENDSKITKEYQVKF
ncbi:hypothetical protein P8625_15300 [Tenacibaculum tangerinum]|uniref:DUF4468 domain-containing protein n=1 Tax=Tenacibaculum tangerinum TaxID=3038772 RepID=A0ABY8L1T7_9FLAO|nr:hypothetical protein [Tenacibaculum tangerinum]WGH75416.1 hypothetical protein P8625_15300 [Tenacibaculum tangerinum]